MDYEKKYNEALKDMRAIYPNLKGDAKLAVEHAFPELTESDDKRILRVISEAVITFFSDYANDFEDEDRDAALAWLEKQKEQDWNKKPCLTCQEYEKGHKQGYTEGCTAGYNKAMKEVEQKEQKPDTRDADDLQLLGFIYDLLNEIEWKDNWAMSKDECLRRLNNYRPQKPAEWNEEDEEMINTLVDYVEYPSCWNLKCPREKLVAFIKSLPERFNLQPKQEWSEEDEEMIKRVIERIEAEIQYGDALTMTYGNQEIDWLKSLRPSWKPSEEHLSALLAVLNDPNNIGSQTCQLALTELYEQLKKL